MIMADSYMGYNTPANTVPMNTMPAGGNEALDWDSEISNDGQDYVILPKGEYVFQVVDLEKGRHGGSEKLPPCPKATLTLEVKTADGVARIRHNLFLHRTTERYLSEFFRSIGMKAKGEHMKMDWNKVPGAWGRGRFEPRSYIGNDGQEHHANDLVKFLDYDPELVKPGFTDVTGKTPIPF